jgi:hypothetical protein
MLAKKPIKTPKNWFSAFQLLIQFLEGQSNKKGKSVVFFDEMPWLATHRSDFLKSFGYFWNSWAVKKNITVVICGSAASWMIQKVVRDKGGLHNRITRRIYLQPFTLKETELFLLSKNIHFERYHIAQMYMVMGGIPHYLKEIRRGESAAQNIDRICFDPAGLLNDEFNSLYGALFDRPENHIALIRALAVKNAGLHRNELLELSGVPNGGGATKTLEELVVSGFVTEYRPFNRKSKESLFRLTDEYSLFYLKFAEELGTQGVGIWKNLQSTATYKVWSGYAFENLCLKHITQIKSALGIEGVYSTYSSFFQKGKEDKEGCQVDLVIDRNDQVINLCEMKFYNGAIQLTKEMANTLRNRIALFKYYTKTPKQIFLTFISSFGLLKNSHSLDIVDSSLTMDDLFR